MKALYLECGMGASGDMLAAALLEVCGGEREDFLRRMNGAGIPGVEVAVEAAARGGIAGSRVAVRVDGREEGCGGDGGVDGNDGHHHSDNRRINEHHHDNHYHDNNHHREHDHDSHHHDNNNSDNHCHDTPPATYHGITCLINGLDIPTPVKKNALEVYKLIADAESHVHGVAVDKIHFHEVGEMDAVADIVGVCMLVEGLAPELILASPINVGGGETRCAHGVLPVPAPATARILQGIPMYGGKIQSELCTPTGAALLRHFVTKFCDMPVMSVSKIGYGMGKKEFERANCLRAYLGDVNSIDTPAEDVAELVCNLDDMTPEAVAFAQEKLLREGALDVYATPTIMKKGRAGVTLTCVCRAADRGKILPQIFKHTTTLGIRERIVRRYTLQREQSEIQTEYGSIRVKTARGFGTEKSKPEYEDIAAIARERDLSIREVSALCARGEK
jgi:uncharacterized protein (TIGR00299 family) protein